MMKAVSSGGGNKAQNAMRLMSNMKRPI